MKTVAHENLAPRNARFRKLGGLVSCFQERPQVRLQRAARHMGLGLHALQYQGVPFAWAISVHVSVFFLAVGHALGPIKRKVLAQVIA